ncbi:1-deoxy-D-xylulose-5-phosphate reductoisomerase [Taibaiella sp. KBW10]|uniref:1-deoxy-D-xylulose-5-phosphate reductoisomerase n=1 Tax=Taibaiella sp. KBW10 TaxID=2153357 RepID=UPI000F5B82FA|nr:1-deoxy-D-xylulose-5-phosphate reductoisomerase [Taibaiella sp. KBW10]RQO32485.1 1-deoxy-D-xylulose-5-phosphate reductoisomerase [Taibaiella sp. KBW10]
MAQKRLAILGSTGSIGTQALEIVDAHPQLFAVEILSAHTNSKLIIEQAIKYKPNAVVITDAKAYALVKQALDHSDIKVFEGHQALNEVVQWDTVDFVLAAIVGYAGLHSTLSAIRAGKTIGLANKETLVVAGALVMQLAAEKNVSIIPVDSEHSAIFQCLVGERVDSIEKIILTASGGPFLGKKPNFLVNVKKAHALQHPNWTMGAKISIDSATLMNKGLEMIEAKWLFGLKNEQIEVVVHPQSIIHSLVQFNDGSLKAQMGLPDMKLPIQYALGFPKRIANDFPRFLFKNYNTLTFEDPDVKTFRNLQLATQAMHKSGNMPCVLNAANEVVVTAFINNKVGFLEMSDIIEQTMEQLPFIENPNIEELIASDLEARLFAEQLLQNNDY